MKKDFYGPRVRRTVAAFAATLLVTVLAQAVAQRPAAAADNPQKGIQAGDVLFLNDDGTCGGITPFGQQLLDDTELQAQTSWVRLDLRRMQSHTGCGAPAQYADFLSRLAGHISVIGLLGANFSTATTPQDFAAYAGTIACDAGFAGIDVWEVYNEPNLAGTPGATYLGASDFARYVGHTARAIRNAQTDCGVAIDKVISGGLANAGPEDPADPVDYLAATAQAFVDNSANYDFAAGYGSLNDAVDGIGIHPYVTAIQPDLETEGPTVHDSLTNMVYVFTNGYSGIPIYITEFGWRRPATDEPIGGEVVTEEFQCHNLIKAYEALSAPYYQARVLAATWFTLQDFDDHKRYGLYNGGVAQDAREGYLDGTCPENSEAGVYNQPAGQLEWQDGVAALATVSYEVVMAKSDSPTYTMTRPTSAKVLPLMGWSPPLAPDEYVWRVIKVVDGKRYASKEQWKFVFTGLPSAPIGPSITAAPDGTALTLSWTDTALTEDGFVISDGAENRGTNRDATSFTWTGLTPGSSRCLKVQSANFYGGSAFTSPVCATTPTLPATPTGVTATVLSGTSVRINWTDNATNELRYEVYDGTTTRPANADDTSLTWDGLTNGASKCFRVRAYNAVGYTPYAAAPCVVTPTLPLAPTTPVVSVVNGSALKITWVDKSNNENGFQVTDGAEIKPPTAANITSFTWGNLAYGTTKCLKVRSFNLAGYSAWTTQKCATTPTLPAAPTGPVASVVSGTSLRLGWTDRSTNETGFEVNNGTTDIRPAAANATSFVWTGLPNGSYQCLRVRSKNLAGTSAWSAYSCATTPTLPAAPTISSVYAISSSQIVIYWADRSSNETQFQVYNQVYFRYANANVTSLTWDGIAPNTTMCFNVRSYNLAGSSAPTPYLCATTMGPPISPGYAAVSRISSSTLRIGWTDRSNNETGFQILDNMTGGIITIPYANRTEHYVGGLAQGTYKCYQVRSYNQWGSSAWTAQSCAATY